MNPAMDIDSTPVDDSQPDLHNPDEEATNFNLNIQSAIKNYKSTHPRTFMFPRLLLADDAGILLRILLESIHEECRVRQYHCQGYIKDHPLLHNTLYEAYASQAFAYLRVDGQLPSVDEVAGCASITASGISPSNSNSTIQTAFQRGYRGNTAKLFIRTLNKEREMRHKKTAAQAPYNWTISVVQSSGMGKSRMVEEAGNSVFTIPFNLREDMEEGKNPYPPSDANMRQFFIDRQGKTDLQQQIKYAVFLGILFTRVSQLVKEKFRGLAKEKLARAWADYLGEGQTVTEVGSNRQTLYEDTIQDVKDEIVRNKPQKLEDVEGSLKKSCGDLLELVDSDQSDDSNACFVYFDEAHSLTETVPDSDGGHKRNPFHNLGTVLSKLVNHRIFFIFLSTNSRIEGFDPPATHYPSERVTLGSQLVPPFTELPFDIYDEKVLKRIESLTLTEASSVKVMVSFGRPLWYADRKAHPKGDVFDFAVDKLAANGVVERKSDALLAALGVRVGVSFDETNSYSIQSKLVESHLRVVYSIPEDRTYIHTGSPSEPVLAEAAGRFLSTQNLGGVVLEGPRQLSNALTQGFLARGERGELVGRLLVTAAHDIALENLYGELKLTHNKACYHRPIPVLEFLRALFAQQHHSKIMGAACVTREPGTGSLAAAFSESYVFFSHFARAEDAEMLSAFGLATALVRGMALQAKEGQISIDAVIPIHMASLDIPISPQTTSAINLQFKNGKDSSNCHVNRLITVPGRKTPVISIIFDFGVKGKRADYVEISHHNRTATRNANPTHQDDYHYEIVARGCSPAVYGPITDETKFQYRAILGAGTVLEDFARCDDSENVEALRALKPAFSGKRERERYKQWESASNDIRAT
ncbi:unnamed protein product [Rhizoctonia solani]|uniref:G2/mitotic-specific cyclin cdc13 n=1 Tax=Rhizoctonia solani TaxID=456999 RepID=A0A8H2XY73_9AGAM|nr:unnamed protein product [Rhizoctonia solani]